MGKKYVFMLQRERKGSYICKSMIKY